MKNKKLILGGVIGGILSLAAVGVYLDAKKVKELGEEQSKIDEKEANDLSEKRYIESLSSIEAMYSRYDKLAKEALEENPSELEREILDSVEFTYTRRIEKIKKAKENGEDPDGLCRRLGELEEYIEMSFRNISEFFASQK